MLENVLRGVEWQGVVQVPHTMWRHLGHQQEPDTVIDYVDFSPAGTAATNTTAGGRQGSEAQAKGAGDGGETERSKRSVGFLLRQSSSVPVDARRPFHVKSSSVEHSEFSEGFEVREAEQDGNHPEGGY